MDNLAVVISYLGQFFNILAYYFTLHPSSGISLVVYNLSGTSYWVLSCVTVICSICILFVGLFSGDVASFEDGEKSILSHYTTFLGTLKEKVTQ